MKIPYLNLYELNHRHQREIDDAALQVTRSGFYLNDATVRDFEQEWARYCNCKYCVSTANGLDALTAILTAMKTIYKWKNGSQVIVSAHTFIASFQAISLAGLSPVPCDVSDTTYLINTDLIESMITPSTVAIMPVHLYGRVCEMRAITDIADKHGLKIVSDACQAHGTCKSTDLGDAAAFSFYPGKNLGAMGDGGCVVTNDEEIAYYVRTYCNYGANIKYKHEIKGINSRLASIQAAILQTKLKKLDEENRQRQDIAKRYLNNISSNAIRLPYIPDDYAISNWHIFPILCNNREVLQNKLLSYGIETLIHYPVPPHKQKACYELNALSMPVTEDICARELSLPLNSTLTIEQQDYIINTLNSL